MRSRSVALVLCALSLACGGDGGPAAEAELPRREWVWVDVPGAVCANGSQTGIAVNRGDDDARVVLVLDGGGACWDPLTCVTFELASDGPYGEAQFAGDLESLVPGSILDRALEGNPFATSTLVFVPYCTGDVHAGDATQVYSGRRWRHKGLPNLVADTTWLAEALPPPEQVVVSGASAGGYGALLAHDAIRQRWPDARGYLVDDSGPPLVGDDFSPVVRAAWFAAWRLDETLLPLCEECVLDLSELLPRLAEKYPSDRLALLSTTRDEVIRGFVGLSGASFESALLRLRDDVVTPLPNAETFLVPGSGHTFLGAPGDASAGGVPLTEWLRRMVEDEEAWGSVGP